MQRHGDNTTPFTFNFNNSSSSPLSYTPSPTSSIDDDTENRLCLARLTLQYQELLSRYGLCVTHLQDASKHIDNLRQENLKLRIANKDLTKRYQLLSDISVRNITHRYNNNNNNSSLANFPSLSIINDFRNLNVGGGGESNNGRVNGGSESPTSVIELEKKSVGVGGGERVALPKSISIRSSGYVKNNPPTTASAPAASAAAGGTTTNRVRSVSPVRSNDTKRVFVPGGNKEEQALEFDVFNQGMTKTELCNKWQETGACPYGDHCQFAHGINELRPVIRHPRYKTEVCRMVLAGDICPYGHRCHFRHALTEQEKFRGTTA